MAGTPTIEQQVVQAVGGIEKVLELCLTHEKADEHIKKDDVLELERLLLPANWIVPNLTQSDFFHYKTAVRVNASNNLYFKILPPKVASFVYYKILLKDWYVVSVYGLYFLFAVICNVCLHMGYPELWTLFAYISMSFAILSSVTFLFSINTDIFKLVLKTFDFWFSMYNFVIYMIGAVVVGEQHLLPILLVLVWDSTVIFNMLSVFVIDTYFLSFNMRVYVTVIKLLIWLYHLIMRFLFTSDVKYTWNPLGFLNVKFTMVNFKFVWMSSLVNMMIFIGKPVIGYVMVRLLRKLKECKRCCKGKTQTSHKPMANVHSSFTIRQQKPILCWNRVL